MVRFNYIFLLLDIGFADPVYPTQIEIYETYNPGAVVRILAYKYGEGNTIFDSRCCMWLYYNYLCVVHSSMLVHVKL